MTGEVLGNGRDWQRILREGVKNTQNEQTNVVFLVAKQLYEPLMSVCLSVCLYVCLKVSIF